MLVICLAHKNTLLYKLFRLFIYIAVFIFRVYDCLRVIQAVISRKHIADGDGGQKVIGVVKAKQLKADEQSGNRAIGYAAEYGGHPDGGAQRGICADKGGENTAEGRAYKKGGDDFAAFIACADSDRREQYL